MAAEVLDELLVEVFTEGFALSAQIADIEAAKTGRHHTAAATAELARIGESALTLSHETLVLIGGASVAVTLTEAGRAHRESTLMYITHQSSLVGELRGRDPVRIHQPTEVQGNISSVNVLVNTVGFTPFRERSLWAPTGHYWAAILAQDGVTPLVSVARIVEPTPLERSGLFSSLRSLLLTR